MVQRKKTEPNKSKLAEASDMWGKFQQPNESAPAAEDITVTPQPEEQPAVTPPSVVDFVAIPNAPSRKPTTKEQKPSDHITKDDVANEVTGAMDALQKLTGHNEKIYRTTSFRIEEGLMHEFNSLFVDRGSKTKAINHALRLVINLAKGNQE